MRHFLIPSGPLDVLAAFGGPRAPAAISSHPPPLEPSRPFDTLPPRRRDSTFRLQSPLRHQLGGPHRRRRPSPPRAVDCRFVSNRVGILWHRVRRRCRTQGARRNSNRRASYGRSHCHLSEGEGGGRRGRVSGFSALNCCNF